MNKLIIERFKFVRISKEVFSNKHINFDIHSDIEEEILYSEYIGNKLLEIFSEYEEYYKAHLLKDKVTKSERYKSISNNNLLNSFKQIFGDFDKRDEEEIFFMIYQIFLIISRLISNIEIENILSHPYIINTIFYNSKLLEIPKMRIRYPNKIEKKVFNIPKTKVKKTPSIREYECNSILDYFNICLSFIIENDITINKCKNCGKFFIPINKDNQTLCNYEYKEGKSCRELAYKLKLEKNEIASIHDKNRKRQYQRLRIIKISDTIREKEKEEAEIKYKNYMKMANRKKRECEKNIISIEEYKKWLEENDNWLNKKVIK